MPAWTHKGFEEFSKGRFDNSGDNLYVNADGGIETIHRFGVNNDGYRHKSLQMAEVLPKR